MTDQEIEQYYTQEACTYFAIALNNLFGYQMGILFDPYETEWFKSGDPVHVFCYDRVTNEYIDVRGKQTLQEMKDRMGVHDGFRSSRIERTDQAELRKRFMGDSDRKPFSRYRKYEIDEAEIIIKQNMTKYAPITNEEVLNDSEKEFLNLRNETLMTKGILTERARKEQVLMYHGTSSAFLRSILKNGIVPNPKNRLWDGDEEANISNPSRESIPNSSYWATNFFTAYSSGNSTSKKFDGNTIIVAALLMPESMLADEDDIKFVMSDAMNSVGIHGWGKQDVSIKMKAIIDVNSDSEYVQKILDTAHERLVAVKGLPPSIKKPDKDVLMQWLILTINRDLSYYRTTDSGGYAMKKNYCYGISFDHYITKEEERQVWDDVWFEENVLSTIPQSQEAERDLILFYDKLTRHYRALAKRSRSETESSFSTARISESVTFSGRNRIVCIAELVNDEKKYLRKVVIHYGEMPQEMSEDIRQRIGDRYQVVKREARMTESKIIQEYEERHVSEDVGDYEEYVEGKVYSSNDIVSYIRWLGNHHYNDETDIEDRISNSNYVLKNIPVLQVEVEWNVDNDYVEDWKMFYEKHKFLPPIVLSDHDSIVDGTHRLQASIEMGLSHIMTFIPVDSSLGKSIMTESKSDYPYFNRDRKRRGISHNYMDIFLYDRRQNAVIPELSVTTTPEDAEEESEEGGTLTDLTEGVEFPITDYRDQTAIQKANANGGDVVNDGVRYIICAHRRGNDSSVMTIMSKNTMQEQIAYFKSQRGVVRIAVIKGNNQREYVRLDNGLWVIGGENIIEEAVTRNRIRRVLFESMDGKEAFSLKKNKIKTCYDCYALSDGSNPICMLDYDIKEGVNNEFQTKTFEPTQRCPHPQNENEFRNAQSIEVGDVVRVTLPVMEGNRQEMKKFDVVVTKVWYQNGKQIDFDYPSIKSGRGSVRDGLAQLVHKKECDTPKYFKEEV